MEYRFSLSGGGMLTLRTSGERVECRGDRPDDGKGLYKGYLTGPGGRVTLGTFLPEEGRLALRRTLSLQALERQGVWPPTGAGAELAFRAGQQAAHRPAPPGWRWEAAPARLLGDATLAQALGGQGALLRQEEGGFALALPFDVGRPFPLPPLFCLAQVQPLDGRTHAIFSFSKDGQPRLPHKTDGTGHTTGAIQTKEEMRRGQSDHQRTQRPV